MKKLVPFLFVLVLALCLPAQRAAADMTIMPIRVVFEDRQRSAELTIINTSQRTNTYRLEWGYRRMKEEGGYEQLDGPMDTVFNPEQHIVFSPRQVTIAPGETQRVRLSLRRPAELPDGEYRAHLMMKRISDGAEPRRPLGGPNGMSFQMGTNVGFSVPVIVRQGAYDAAATISDPEFKMPEKAGDMPALMMTINRQGVYSITGSVKVYWTPPGQSERLVGTLNNLNVFHEIEKRRVGVVLNESNITSGTMRIVLEGVDKMRGVVFDERSFPVGG